ncbi:MAG TPA: sugar transferase [Verrucomicrobiota bacterium]|nr:sugar transferase [Verrucomicrobiota bacterium]HOK78216.1 sugar transferase [Verrucomicrobiota bacterium]
MLRRQQEIRGRVQMLLDALLFGVAFYVAHRVRSHWQFEILGGSKTIAPFSEYAWLLLLVIPGGPFVLRGYGFYNRPLVPSRRLTYWQLFKSCAALTIALVLVLWVLRSDIGRSVIILFGALSFLFIGVKEELLINWRRSKFGQSFIERRLILVGTADDADRLRADLARGRHDGLVLVAQLNLNEAPVDKLVDLLHEHSANGVILTAKHTYFGQIEQAIEVCEREGVEVWLLADFFKTRISQTTVDVFMGRPTLVFRSGPEVSWPMMVKRVIDFAGAAVLILIFGVPMLIVALAIKLTSPGPVLFRQLRSGLNGKPFTMLKFRSMVTDAEQRRHELEVLNEMSGPVFKVTNDPRVTPLGRFLRRYSIDEWPQLFNVLRGEMSLVGPRPLPVDEVKRFDDLAHRRRLSVKPGLTCLWQVSGRNNVRDFREWVRLDLEYIDNWSLWLDLKILLRTIPAVLSGTGAK